MADFYINKLIVKGAGKKDAVAVFARGLTIISGPSNTGKTTILRCIDYIFGSKDLTDKLKRVEVGDFEDWIKLSDHLPMISIVDLAG